MKKAIVTIVIGNKYTNLFEVTCKQNWQSYCNKYEYELIIITEPLDNSDRAQKRSVAWQKLLILSQKWSTEYDRIVWIDADILINNKNAHDIIEGVPIDKIGAVEAFSIPTREIHEIALDRLYKTWSFKNIPYINNSEPSKYYTNRNIPGSNLTEVVQTGVFICSPIYHRMIFENIYFNYEDTHGSEWNYEMPAMSFELINANLVHWISPRFNYVVKKCIAAFYPYFEIHHKNMFVNYFFKIINYENTFSVNFESYYLNNIYELSNFMHFAGCLNLMDKIKPIN
jgi:hypothetical protein